MNTSEYIYFVLRVHVYVSYARPRRTRYHPLQRQMKEVTLIGGPREGHVAPRQHREQYQRQTKARGASCPMGTRPPIANPRRPYGPLGPSGQWARVASSSHFRPPPAPLWRHRSPRRCLPSSPAEFFCYVLNLRTNVAARQSRSRTIHPRLPVVIRHPRPPARPPARCFSASPAVSARLPDVTWGPGLAKFRHRVSALTLQHFRLY
jgi:hypothetical protein